MRRLILFTAAWLILGSAANLFAQGVQTGTIRGLVKDQQDLAVPGVTVTVTSPAVQGPRSTVTDKDGQFVIRALPPGDYQIKFELSGFATITRNTPVPLGLVVETNVSMRAAGVAETVQVTAESPAPIVTPVVGLNFKHEEIESLPNLRTIQGIAQLAPATTTNSPNATQVVINGAFAFDNIFMVNGVDINDNLFANPRNLFIEDAIEETQVLTSGISAEYGRFGGGVINAITKSGANTFSGSARVNFLNTNWTTVTPFEASKSITKHCTIEPCLQRTYEGTFGGPIVKDRLWYFLSGRYAAVSSQVTLPVSGLQITRDDKDKRGEIKLTGTPLQGHTIQGGFLNDPRTLVNASGLPDSFLIDPHDLVNQTFPNHYFYTNYKGVLSNSLLVEAQFSTRHFQFNQTGPSGSSILDSPFIDVNGSVNYNAPYFDATDPESRNNKQLTGNVTKYWSLGGRHETKSGYEWFRSQRTGGNSQSATSYVFGVDFATNASGGPALDSTGRPIPNFVPGESYIEYFPAIKGAVLDIDNNSIFSQDHWTISPKWSADLGARYEHVRVASTGGIVSISNNRIVPRLAVAFDVLGNGNHVVHASYGQYAGRYNEAQVGKNSPVGNPPEVDSLYQGPAGQGYGFAPGMSVANYPITAANVIFLSDAKQNVFVDPGMKSPLTHEFSLSYGANLLNGRGYGEVSYVGRVTHSIIEDFQTIGGGFTNVVVAGVNAGKFTNIVYQNTNLANRQYQGLVFQSRYRITNRWSVNGHYTVQLKNDGNYEGEGASKPGNTGIIGNYPEAFNAARNYPDGRLQSFQRSRVRIWTVYDWNLNRWGDVSVSGLLRVDSGREYSLAQLNVNPTATQKAIITKAGYPDAAVTQTVFFTGARGDQTFPGYGLFDMSFNYNIPVFRTSRPWVKFDIYNLFDNNKVIAWNTTVKQDTTTPLDNLGLRTGYVPSNTAAFGTATGNTVSNLNLNNINAFPLAFPGATPGGRTFRVAVGFRF
jgi:carboxypeptidase family protein/TonB-dependent receptor-like protein